MAKVPEGFALAAHSDACPNVAIADEKRGLYGVQYHPEVNHTEHGVDMIRNFLYEVCGAKGDWTMGDYKESSIKRHPGEGGRRQGAAGPVRRRGFLRGRRTAGRGGGQPAHLCVRGPRPDAQERGRRGGRPPSAKMGHPLHPRGRRSPLPGEALAGVTEPGAQAQNHRRGVHPRLRGGSQKDRPGGLSWCRAPSTRT